MQQMRRRTDYRSRYYDKRQLFMVRKFLENSMVSVHLVLMTKIYYRQIIHLVRFHSKVFGNKLLN